MAVATEGETFRQLRIERGLSLADAARASGVDERRLRKIEDGVVGAWFIEALDLAAAYGLTIEELSAEVMRGRQG